MELVIGNTYITTPRSCALWGTCQSHCQYIQHHCRPCRVQLEWIWICGNTGEIEWINCFFSKIPQSGSLGEGWLMGWSMRWRYVQINLMVMMVCSVASVIWVVIISCSYLIEILLFLLGGKFVELVKCLNTIFRLICGYPWLTKFRMFFIVSFDT